MMVNNFSDNRDSIQISAVTAADLGDLERFMTEWPGDELLGSKWRSRFNHWWDSNPYFSADTIRGYAIKDMDRIVGFQGLIPMTFQIAGQESLVFASSTWRVLPDYRRLSLKLLSLILQAGRETLVFGWSASEAIVQAHLRFGFKRIQRPEAFAHKVPSTLLLQLFNARRKSLRLLSIFFSAHSALAYSKMKFLGRKLESRRILSATKEVDNFWDTTKGLIQNTHVRSSTFLNWYCFSGAVFHKRIYGCYRQSTLCGLIVFGEKAPQGLRVLECLDIWIDWTIPGVLDSLLSAAMRDAWKEGINGIELPPFSQQIQDFAKSHWCIPRQVTRYPEFVCGPKEKLDTFLSGDTALFGPVGDYYL